MNLWWCVLHDGWQFFLIWFLWWCWCPQCLDNSVRIFYLCREIKEICRKWKWGVKSQNFFLFQGQLKPSFGHMDFIYMDDFKSFKDFKSLQCKTKRRPMRSRATCEWRMSKEFVGQDIKSQTCLVEGCKFFLPGLLDEFLDIMQYFLSRWCLVVRGDCCFSGISQIQPVLFFRYFFYIIVIVIWCCYSLQQIIYSVL